MSDRVFAFLWLVVCAAIAWLARMIEAPFSYEPIGPRAFPLLLAALMALSAAWLLVRPDREPDWPRGALRAKSLLLIVAFVAYAMFFEWLGFVVATALATVVIGRLFDGSWKGCVLAGIALGGGLWYFFDRLLDVTLPLGRLWALA
ncbi:MAG TPA: tripartite tricarboxylate transporter TctB family protein [Usitatibacteraceae bacterium]|nr:tripartite tricarboxylate transporter TctB family protein [Usitatibacteraceae bacterium]